MEDYYVCTEDYYVCKYIWRETTMFVNVIYYVCDCKTIMHVNVILLCITIVYHIYANI